MVRCGDTGKMPVLRSMDPSQEIPYAMVARECFCEQCGNNLSLLPAEARFCPRCGFDRVERASVMPLELQYSSPPPNPGLPTLPVLIDGNRFHSLMVVGYARALSSLATRYQAGHGVMRNGDEALRYYCKAARLGCEEAITRLEQRGIVSASATASPTSPDSPSDPPASPEAPEPQSL
jgi:hypothetical protein